MAFQLKSILETTAYTFLNQAIARYHSDEGLARNNRWEILITPPQSGNFRNVFTPVMNANTGAGITESLGVMCEQFAFPGRNLDSSPDTNLYGPEREVVNGYSFGDITSVWRLSTDQRERQFFDTWQRLAYNPTDFSIGYYNDYVGEIRIFQLDEKDRRRYGIKLLECFPKTVDQMGTTQGAGDLQRLTVTWAYRYWLSLADEADHPREPENSLGDILLNTFARNLIGNIPSVLNKLF
tara:strand:- start:2620 stop:3333 length:714 start_codon:yes stop_codon:yes gene_type:complete